MLFYMKLTIESSILPKFYKVVISNDIPVYQGTTVFKNEVLDYFIVSH